MFSFKKEDPSEWPDYYIESGIELVKLDILEDSYGWWADDITSTNIKAYLYNRDYS